MKQTNPNTIAKDAIKRSSSRRNRHDIHGVSLE